MYYNNLAGTSIKEIIFNIKHNHVYWTTCELFMMHDNKDGGYKIRW